VSIEEALVERIEELMATIQRLRAENLMLRSKLNELLACKATEKAAEDDNAGPTDPVARP